MLRRCNSIVDVQRIWKKLARGGGVGWGGRFLLTHSRHAYECADLSRNLNFNFAYKCEKMSNLKSGCATKKNLAISAKKSI